jgi:hypothetical protein
MKISNKIEPSGRLFVEHWRKGSIFDRYNIPNSVTIEGKNSILRTNFHNGTQILHAYVSLIDSVGYVSLSDNDTYQGINLSNNWLEFAGYSDPNSNGDTNTRPVWYTDEASGQTITNTTKSLFDITENCTIVGLFVVTGPNSQIKGDNSVDNSLWATALFLKGNVDLEIADQLRVIYTIAT